MIRNIIKTSSCGYCGTSSCPGIVFKTDCCKDTFCPETLLDYLKSQRTNKAFVDPTCPNCNKRINIDLIHSYCNQELKSYRKYHSDLLEQILYRTQPLYICKGGHSVPRNRKKDDRLMVECPTCAKNFCTKCCNWISKLPCTFCGLSHRNKILSSAAIKGFFNYGGDLKFNSFDTRACISCGFVIRHTQYCKIMSCMKCNEKFCLVCLRKGDSCSNHWEYCNIVGIQEFVSDTSYRIVPNSIPWTKLLPMQVSKRT